MVHQEHQDRMVNLDQRDYWVKQDLPDLLDSLVLLGLKVLGEILVVRVYRDQMVKMVWPVSRVSKDQWVYQVAVGLQDRQGPQDQQELLVVEVLQGLQEVKDLLDHLDLQDKLVDLDQVDRLDR